VPRTLCQGKHEYLLHLVDAHSTNHLKPRQYFKHVMATKIRLSRLIRKANAGFFVSILLAMTRILPASFTGRPFAWSEERLRKHGRTTADGKPWQPITADYEHMWPSSRRDTGTASTSMLVAHGRIPRGLAWCRDYKKHVT
jgi:hypothetical protein